MTTCEDRVQGERLARELVEQRLGACVSIGAPVISAFPWEGKIDIATEVPLTIKTTAERLPGLKRAFAEHHPYEVPEMLVVPVIDGLEAYFAWAEDWMKNEK
ncbi:MAG: divalent-cation tolerance protein CutA [Wenzhouxiangella sp.]